eukprot:6806576-Alexandrium_andersonii.AAC.1
MLRSTPPTTERQRIPAAGGLSSPTSTRRSSRGAAASPRGRRRAARLGRWRSTTAPSRRRSRR